jgi:hypothetical protein
VRQKEENRGERRRGGENDVHDIGSRLRRHVIQNTPAVCRSRRSVERRRRREERVRTLVQVDARLRRETTGQHEAGTRRTEDYVRGRAISRYRGTVPKGGGGRRRRRVSFVFFFQPASRLNDAYAAVPPLHRPLFRRRRCLKSSSLPFGMHSDGEGREEVARKEEEEDERMAPTTTR